MEKYKHAVTAKLSTKCPRIVRGAAVCLLAGLIMVWLAGCGAEDWAAIRERNARTDLTAFRETTDALPKPLTLDAAINRALDGNLEHSLLTLQLEIQNEVRTGAHLGMLPSLSASANLNRRDKFRASTSQSLETGQVSLEPSYSSEKKTRTAELRLMWSILDFGISYVRARQAGKEALLLEQQARRMRQNLALSVTRAWYMAAVSTHALHQAETIMREAEERLTVIRRQVRQKTLPELVGLEGEEVLVLMRMRLQEYEDQRRNAEAELASLLGVPAGTEFEFPELQTDMVEPVSFDLNELELAALQNRPELFESDLQAAMSTDDVRMAALGMLPNPTASVTRATDRNSFLAFNTWWEAGVQVAWDLLSLPRKASEVRLAQRRRELQEKRRIMVAAGVLVQTHLAVGQYETARTQYTLAKDLASVRSRRLEALRKRFEQGQADAGKLLEAEAEALFGSIDALRGYADVQLSLARIRNSTGNDPAPARMPQAAEVDILSDQPLAEDGVNPDN